MIDLVEDLRRKARQATPAFPHVRVTGAYLAQIADELERLREAAGHEAILFEQRAAQVRQGVG